MAFTIRHKRHIHDTTPKEIGDISGLTWIEECSCGRRRTVSMGCGRATATIRSQWYGIEDFTKLKQCFPEWFKR
jgi:hypothetical protein